MMVFNWAAIWVRTAKLQSRIIPKLEVAMPETVAWLTVPLAAWLFKQFHCAAEAEVVPVVQALLLDMQDAAV